MQRSWLQHFSNIRFPKQKQQIISISALVEIVLNLIYLHHEGFQRNQFALDTLVVDCGAY